MLPYLEECQYRIKKIKKRWLNKTFDSDPSDNKLDITTDSDPDSDPDYNNESEKSSNKSDNNESEKSTKKSG